MQVLAGTSSQSTPLYETEAELVQLLNQDISQLVQDAEPIRIILKSLKDRLLEPIKEALIPAAFIESRQVPSPQS